MEALHTLSGVFDSDIPEKRVVVGSNATVRKAMKGVFRDSDVLLKETLDELMKMFRVPDPEYYDQYLSSRVIVDLGHGKKHVSTPAPTGDNATVEGTVRKADTEEVVAEAKVSLVGTNVLASTDVHGKYKLIVPWGKYMIRAEKEGFVTSNENISLQKGDEMELDLEV